MRRVQILVSGRLHWYAPAGGRISRRGVREGVLLLRQTQGCGVPALRRGRFGRGFRGFLRRGIATVVMKLS